MTVLRYAFPFLLAVSTQAGAACTLLDTAVDLPAGATVAGVRGTLSFTVRCERPEDTYMVTLWTDSRRVQPEGRHLLLNFWSPRGDFVTGTLPTGVPFTQAASGTRRYSFPLMVNIQQWTRAGQYSLPLILDLEPARLSDFDAPSGATFADLSIPTFFRSAP